MLGDNLWYEKLFATLAKFQEFYRRKYGRNARQLLSRVLHDLKNKAFPIDNGVQILHSKLQ